MREQRRGMEKRQVVRGLQKGESATMYFEDKDKTVIFIVERAYNNMYIMT